MVSRLQYRLCSKIQQTVLLCPEVVCRVNSFSPLLPTGSIAHDAICDFPGISNYQAQLASKIGELGVNMSDIFHST